MGKLGTSLLFQISQSLFDGPSGSFSIYHFSLQKLQLSDRHKQPSKTLQSTGTKIHEDGRRIKLKSNQRVLMLLLPEFTPLSLLRPSITFKYSDSQNRLQRCSLEWLSKVLDCFEVFISSLPFRQNTNVLAGFTFNFESQLFRYKTSL